MKKARNAIIIAAIAVGCVVAAMVGCQDSLAVKAAVEERVEQELYWTHGIKTLVEGANYSPAIAVNGSNVYVLYFDLSASQLKLMKSSDRGKTWGVEYIVNSTIGYYGTSNNIAVDGSILYIAYTLSSTVYFLKLADIGSGFEQLLARTITTSGYENSLAYDNGNVYVVYWNEGPLYSYAAKGATMTFSSPAYVDSALDPGTSATRTETSTFIDSNGDVNIAYFDYQNDILKLADFAPDATLPASVSGVNVGSIVSPVYITAADSPSAVSPYLISFYDTSTHAYKLFEYYTYGSGAGPLYLVRNTVTIDATSSDVGQNGILRSYNSKLFTAYFDGANKKLRFAVGIKAAANADYAFSSTEICSVGSTSAPLAFAVDSIDGICYIAYYDSSGSGGLKLAKSSDGGATW